MINKEVEMITVEKLKENGYRFFKEVGHMSDNRGFFGLYQKCIKDNVGKKYFINVYHWNLGKVIPHAEDRDSFEVDLGFDLPNDDYVSLKLHSRKSHTIEFIEQWSEDTWRNLFGLYYETYGE